MDDIEKAWKEQGLVTKYFVLSPWRSNLLANDIDRWIASIQDNIGQLP